MILNILPHICPCVSCVWHVFNQALELTMCRLVGNAVTCKLRPTGFKVNAVYRAQCFFIVEPLEVFQPFSPIIVRRHLFDWWINIHHMIAITSTTICNFRCFTKEICQCFFSFSLFFSPLLFPRAVVSSLSPDSGKQWLSDWPLILTNLKTALNLRM